MKLQTLKPRIKTLESRLSIKPIETPRQRGSGWMARRAKLLRSSPLCCMCEAAGRTTLATEVDHIVPLFMGGPDIDSNTQNLCVACHVAKTKLDLSGG